MGRKRGFCLIYIAFTAEAPTKEDSEQGGSCNFREEKALQALRGAKGEEASLLERPALMRLGKKGSSTERRGSPLHFAKGDCL